MLRFSKQLALLVYLAARPRARASREELLGLLWEGSSPTDARHALRQVVFQLRQATDAGFVTGEEELVLRRENLELDVDVFRRGIADGRLEEAMQLYEADFLAAVSLSGAREFERWADGLRQQLAAERRQVLRTLITGARDAGRWAEAARWAQLLAEADPFDLDSRVRLVEARAHAGDGIGAAAAANEARVLAAERGDDSAREFDAVLARALAPSLAAEPVTRLGFLQHPEMVGRAHEYRAVVEAWKGAQAGAGGAVLISGEGGIGKTRLVEEVSRRFRLDGAHVLHAACHAVESSDPLAPFLELLRAAHDAPGLGGAQPASLSLLAAFVPEVAGRFAAAIQPQQLPIERELLSAAMLDAFTAIAHEAPLVVVLEDLHWAQSVTVEFAHRLGRRAREARLLVLLTARDYGGSASVTDAVRALATSPVVTEIALGPLDHDDAVQLLASVALVPDQKTAGLLARRLVELTGGLPLYLLESLKALHQGGALRVVEGAWRIDPALVDSRIPLPLPESGEALLGDRLQRLGARPALLLAALSVWGRAVGSEELARLAGLAPGEAQAALAALERARVVSRTGALVAVAHDEVAAAALRVSSAGMLEAVRIRAADLAEERAARGQGGEWAWAAQHAAAAGNVDRAARCAARAAALVGRGAGHKASREALAALVAGMPDGARGELETAFTRVLAGRWSPARWLDEREGRARRRRLQAAAAGALVLLGGAAALRLGASGAEPPPLGGGYVVLGSAAAETDPDSASVAAYRLDSAFAARRAPLDSLAPGVRAGFPHRAVRPDQRVAARACAAPGGGGARVCARDLTTGRESLLAAGQADARLAAWLPDGSGFILEADYRGADGADARAILHVDASSRSSPVVRDGSRYRLADLSPAGGRLVVARDDSSVSLVFSLEGRLIARYQGCAPATDRWAPHGRYLACVSEDRRELRFLDATEFAVRRSVALPAPAASPPVWSPDGTLVAVLVGAGTRSLIVLHPGRFAEPRVVASVSARTAVLGWQPARLELPGRLRVEPESAAVWPGARTSFRVIAYDSAGAVLDRAPPARWLLNDSSVGRIDEAGRFDADRPGLARVVARFGVTLADTAVVAVGRPPRRAVLHETFERGLGQSGWRPFGTPPPLVLPGRGLRGTSALNPDGGFGTTSGVVYDRMLETARGLTIEYWARILGTGAPGQESFVALRDAPPDSFLLGRSAPTGAGGWYGAQAAVPADNRSEQPTLSLVGTTTSFDLVPAWLRDGGWHRYRLVLYPSGEVRWFADGRELAQPVHVHLGRLPRATLVIAGRGAGTLALIDEVSVFEGVHLDAAPAPSGGR